MNCTCPNAECQFRHFICYKNRKALIKICTDNNSSIIAPNKQETNTAVRKANCNYGYLCINPECNFRHNLNPTGRLALSKLYKSYQYEMESMSTTSSASTINQALVAKLNSKQAVVSTQNFYDALDNAEVIAKETNDEIVPKTVIPEVKTFAISFANIVKKSPDDFKQEQFNKMMEMETKDCWDDY
jgi:hypothetical protein